MVAYLMPKYGFCQERLFAGLCFKPAGFGYNLAILAGEPPFLQPTNFWSRVHERHY